MSNPRKMKKPVRRDKFGRFLECGNDNGRPPKVVIDPSLPMERRRAISAAVDRVIPMVIKGKKPEDNHVEEMSIFEACIYRLGILGAQGNRVAANNVVQLAVSNSIAMMNFERWEERERKRAGNSLSQMSNEELMEAFQRAELGMQGDNDDDVDEESASGSGPNSGEPDPLG